MKKLPDKIQLPGSLPAQAVCDDISQTPAPKTE
jgi:hypothetical protein